jgi:hypothetical protein
MSESEKNTQSNDNSIYFILGGVVLVAAVAGFFLLKPKTPVAPTAGTQPVTQTQPAVQPTLAPITKLACEKQYYNPKVGFSEYYLSLEGVDTATTGTISCDYEISVKDKVVKNASVTAELVADATRGGGTFRCITEALALSKGVPTTVAVKVTNPSKATVDCTQTFVLP